VVTYIYRYQTIIDQIFIIIALCLIFYFQVFYLKMFIYFLILLFFIVVFLFIFFYLFYRYYGPCSQNMTLFQLLTFQIAKIFTFSFFFFFFYCAFMTSDIKLNDTLALIAEK